MFRKPLFFKNRFQTPWFAQHWNALLDERKKGGLHNNWSDELWRGWLVDHFINLVAVKAVVQKAHVIECIDYVFKLIGSSNHSGGSYPHLHLQWAMTTTTKPTTIVNSDDEATTPILTPANAR